VLAVKKAPALWRRKKASGEYFGSFHVTIKGVRVNLWTQNAEKARKRRLEAMRGKREFDPDESEAAAEKLIEVLDAPPAPSSSPPELPPASFQPDGPPPELPLALPPMPPASSAPEVVDAQRIDPPPASSWTDDATAAAGAGLPGDEAPEMAGAERTRLSDLPILQGAFITLSRLCVQIQIAAQVAAARKFAGLDVPMLADPPAKDMGEFLAQQGQKWPDTDPREPGRQIWEGFFRRICPDDLPVPDWALAPLVVAAMTLPMQFANASKADPNATPAAPSAPSSPMEAPAGDAAA
jgi:hypothetical protein